MTTSPAPTSLDHCELTEPLHWCDGVTLTLGANERVLRTLGRSLADHEWMLHQAAREVHRNITGALSAAQLALEMLEFELAGQTEMQERLRFAHKAVTTAGMAAPRVLPHRASSPEGIRSFEAALHTVAIKTHPLRAKVRFDFSGGNPAASPRWCHAGVGLYGALLDLLSNDPELQVQSVQVELCDRQMSVAIHCSGESAATFAERFEDEDGFKVAARAALLDAELALRQVGPLRIFWLKLPVPNSGSATRVLFQPKASYE